MKRFWVTLPDEIYNLLAEKANAENATISALAKEILTNEVAKSSDLTNSLKSISVSDIKTIITTNLSQMPDDEEFNICSLFPTETWKQLSRSDKMIASKTLSRVINNDSRFELSSVKNKVNYYVKRKEH